ncbi:MAG: hypothetical protein QXQ81_01820 [Candidatus Thorarchaeota archaeon]
MDRPVSSVTPQHLGIREDEWRFRVLSVLLRASKTQDQVPFSVLYDMLSQTYPSSKIRESAAYSLLMELEEEEYISVDRTGYRHRYTANAATMRRALQKRVRTVLQSIMDELDRTVTQLKVLEEWKRRHESTVTGSIGNDYSVQRVETARGIETTLLLVEKYIFSRAHEGSIVRIHSPDLEMRLLDSDNEILARILGMGCNVKILLRSDWNDKRDILGSLLRPVSSFVASGALNMAIRSKTTMTYEFVGLEREGTVLSLMRRPPVSVYIPVLSNHRLIAHIGEVFDQEFACGTRVTVETGETTYDDRRHP